MEAGKKYGMLTAIRRVANRKRAVYWLFECECGTRKECSSGNVKSGKIVSCGCKHKKDWQLLVGKKFGRLIVVGIGKTTPKNQYLICEGEDGERIEVRYGHLVSGAIISNGDKKNGIKNSNWKGYGTINGRWYSKYKRGAIKRNITWDIGIKDVNDLYKSQNGRCALTGIPIIVADGRYGKENTASLDRKDNSKGYTIDNVQLVHITTNLFKNKFSDDEFIYMCRLVATHTKDIDITTTEIPRYFRNIKKPGIPK